MDKQVMVDLETLGKQPGSALLSIGAVEFSKDGLGREFYRRIDPRSCEAIGLTLDADTVLWWMLQGDAARGEFAKPAEPISVALLEFSEWIGGENVSSVKLWGNGASFDNTLLGAAYDQAQLPRPWKFWNDRCYRTLAALYPDLKLQRSGDHHNALDDAKSQALHAVRLLNLKGA